MITAIVAATSLLILLIGINLLAYIKERRIIIPLALAAIWTFMLLVGFILWQCENSV